MRFFSSQATMPLPAAIDQLRLDPITIFGVDRVTEAWMDSGPTRLSDKLNQGVPITVRDWPDGEPRTLTTDGVIALAVRLPPAASPNRMARQRHMLEMVAPPYRLRGVVHMPAGADAARYLRAAPQRWRALTDATIATIGEDGGYESEVLLVNMEHVIRR